MMKMMTSLRILMMTMMMTVKVNLNEKMMMSSPLMTILTMMKLLLTGL